MVQVLGEALADLSMSTRRYRLTAKDRWVTSAGTIRERAKDLWVAVAGRPLSGQQLHQT